MPTLMVTFDDGSTALLSACEWVFYNPCGCPEGCSYATTIDEDGAWRAHFDEGTVRQTELQVRRQRERGVTAKLMTRRQWSDDVMPLMTANCPHTPEQRRPAGQLTVGECRECRYLQNLRTDGMVRKHVDPRGRRRPHADCVGSGQPPHGTPAAVRLHYGRLVDDVPVTGGVL